MQNIALHWNRPGLFSRSYSDILKARMRPDVLIVDIDEISLWLDGPNSDNLRFSRTRYIPGEREPGWSVDRY
jgi:hypothetical protein